MKRSWTLVAAIFVSAALGASAQEVDSTRSGPFIGVSAIGAVPNFEGDAFQQAPVTDARISEDVSFGIGARAGWRFLPWLAFEAQYEWIDEWRVKTGRGDCAEVSAQVVTGNLKFIAPFEAAQPYALVGLGGGYYKSDYVPGNQFCVPRDQALLDEKEWEMAARFGGGFDIYLTRSVVFNLETTVVYSDERLLAEDFPFFSISGGLQYRF